MSAGLDQGSIVFACLIAVAQAIGCGKVEATEQSGGTGGSAGSAGGGSAGTDAGGSGGADAGGCAGFGGFGEVVGAHGLRKLDAKFFSTMVAQNTTSVLVAASDSANASPNWVYLVDKGSGAASCLMPHAQNASALVMTDTHLYVAGHEPQGEGPPSDGWIESVALADGASSVIAELPSMHASWMIASTGFLWFLGNQHFWRVPISGGALEDLGVENGAPFGASAGRIYLAGDSEIRGYDVAQGTSEVIALIEGPSSDFKHHSGWIYWRSYPTATTAARLHRVPDVGGTPSVLIDPLGNSFDVGTAVFHSDDAGCPLASLRRVDPTSGADAVWVTGLCYVQVIADANSAFVMSNGDGAGAPGTLYRVDAD